MFIWFPTELEGRHGGLRHKVFLDRDRELFMRRQKVPAHSVELVVQNSQSRESSSELLRQKS